MEQVSLTRTLVAVAILVLAAAGDGRAATRAVVAEGDPAPAGLGGTVERVVSGSIDNAGSVAFAVALSGSETASAVVVASGSEARVVARSGDAAPGGGRYASFEEVDLGDDGHMLFRARLEGGDAEGVFLLTATGVETVAVSGGQSPRGHTYASFTSLSLMADVFDERPSYYLAFVATMSDGRKSLVTGATYLGRLIEPFSVGDAFGRPDRPRRREVVRDFSVSRTTTSVFVVAEVERGEMRDVYERVYLQNESSLHWNDALKHGTRLGRLGRIRDVLGPPAMYRQIAIVALELSHGTSALALWNFTRRAHPIAWSGLAVDGVPAGDALDRFGPPVANSDVDYSPFDVLLRAAAPVTLESGRAALFTFAVDATNLYGEGVRRVVLLDGLDGVAPVEVSDHGLLLVSASEAGRRGLFLVDGLF